MNVEELFSSGPIGLQSTIEGDVNCEHFVIEGTGEGDARIGSIKGKWVCTSGHPPIAWEVLAPTFGYGFECFSRLPTSGYITNFCQASLPEGYVQERQTNFGRKRSKDPGFVH